MRHSKESVQARVTQFGPDHLRADLDSEESRTVHTPAHLLDGKVGILQGDGAQRGEPGGMLPHDSAEELVLGRRELRRSARRCPITECDRNRRKDLHRNAVMIHIGDPGVWRPAPVIDLAVAQPAEHQVCGGLARALDTGPAVSRIAPSQIWQVDVDGVGMDIDEAGASGSVNVDGRASVQQVGWVGRVRA